MKFIAILVFAMIALFPSIGASQQAAVHIGSHSDSNSNNSNYISFEHRQSFNSISTRTYFITSGGEDRQGRLDYTSLGSEITIPFRRLYSTASVRRNSINSEFTNISRELRIGVSPNWSSPVPYSLYAAAFKEYPLYTPILARNQIRVDGMRLGGSINPTSNVYASHLFEIADYSDTNRHEIYSTGVRYTFDNRFFVGASHYHRHNLFNTNLYWSPNRYNSYSLPFGYDFLWDAEPIQGFVQLSPGIQAEHNQSYRFAGSFRTNLSYKLTNSFWLDGWLYWSNSSYFSNTGYSSTSYGTGLRYRF